MCRLLGWASPQPTTLTDVLGADDLAAFTELSCKHADGWGAAHGSGAAVDVRKSPDAARTSPAFRDWADHAFSTLGMVHLRWATLGLDVSPQNTHPFTDGRMAFAHNGSVRPPAALDHLIGADVADLRRGDTDSERYFLAVLTLLRRGATPEEALADTIEHIATSCDFTSLNCLLLTSERLVAACRFNADAPLDGEPPDYFHLRYRTGPDGVVVASTGWGRDWNELRNGELLSVSGAGLTTTVRPLGDAVTAR